MVISFAPEIYTGRHQAVDDARWNEGEVMKWQEGRQGGGYSKLPLIRVGLWGRWFDCLLLKFPTGCFIIQHKDVVPNYRHFRLNITIWPAEGGEFRCDPEAIIYQSRFITFFRPDEGLHEQDLITKGTRYALSFGWARR